MSLDRAIEAAAEALLRAYREGRLSAHSADCVEDARIAVEAAAPHIYEAHLDYRERAALERAERAEAEVERLREFIAGKVDRYAEDGESFLPRGWTLVDGGRLDELEAAEERAERAEAEVERLLADCGDHVSLAVVEDVGNQLRNERAIADELAEALRTALGSHVAAALAAYEEARREP